MSEPTATETVENRSGAAVIVPALTEYVLLERDASSFWSYTTTVEARSAEAAIRSIEAAGTYVAVPARSWKPVTVKAETTTVLRLEEAK